MSWLLFLSLALTACGGLPYHGVGEVVTCYPHDAAAFTQGLVFDGDTLYESTGLYGQSTLRRVELETGEIVQRHTLPDEYFGEGIAIVGDEIVQVTWKAGLGFVYDKETFAVKRRFQYKGEGWGLAYDGERLVMSDGTSWLRFLDPKTLEETDRVQVLDRGEEREGEGQPVARLNELEIVQGEVWANVWKTSQIARIDPQTGDVLGWIDLTELSEEEPAGVLNGIAARGHDRVFVTGKNWGRVCRVEVVSGDD